MAEPVGKDDLEAQVYVKAHFTVEKQDGNVSYHEADVNAYEKIGNLKIELADQLGYPDPGLSQWIRARMNIKLRDDAMLQTHDEGHDNVLITVQTVS